MLAMLLSWQVVAPATPTLAIDGFVVGAKQGGRWSPVETGKGWAKRPPTTFREIGVARLGRSLRAGFVEEEVPMGVYLSAGDTDKDGILVSGAVPAKPRRATELSPNSVAYTKALRRFLDAKGFHAAKARVVRVVRVDLDGDGTQEVLIEARNRDDLTSRGLTINLGPNDYSFVLLRSLRNGKVIDTPLGFAAGRKGYDGLDRKLRAIADIDRDGRMEVVLSYTAWEAFGGSLWSYRAGVAKQLVENGSGV